MLVSKYFNEGSDEEFKKYCKKSDCLWNSISHRCGPGITTVVTWSIILTVFGVGAIIMLVVFVPLCYRRHAFCFSVGSPCHNCDCDCCCDSFYRRRCLHKCFCCCCEACGCDTDCDCWNCCWYCHRCRCCWSVGPCERCDCYCCVGLWAFLCCDRPQVGNSEVDTEEVIVRDVKQEVQEQGQGQDGQGQG